MIVKMNIQIVYKYMKLKSIQTYELIIHLNYWEKNYTFLIIIKMKN